jgi:hypothetical protein
VSIAVGTGAVLILFINKFGLFPVVFH